MTPGRTRRTDIVLTWRTCRPQAAESSTVSAATESVQVFVIRLETTERGRYNTDTVITVSV